MEFPSSLCVSSDSSNSLSLEENQGRQSQSDIDSSVLAEKSMVPMATPNVHSGSMGTPRYPRPSASRASESPTNKKFAHDGLAFERELLTKKGFSSNLISTLLASRKPITTRTYGKVWKKFLSTSGVILSNQMPIQEILEFLQKGLEKGLATNTLKVQIAALGALYNQDLAGNHWDKDHVVATSSPTKKRKAPDWNADLSPKRLCPSGTTQKPKCLSDSEVDQPSLTDDPQSSSQTSSVQDLASLQRSKFGRPLRKLPTPPLSSPKSESASDHPAKEKAVRNVKPSTTKVSKSLTTKSKGKTTLVKIRATRQEDDDEEDADLGFEDENYDLSPDMQNQAPVFIPFHLRSPKPVPAEVEETVEELEIPVDLDNGTSQHLETSLFQHVVDPQVPADKKGQCDGSAEAAMTLISMGSSVYRPNIEEFLIPDQCTENDPSRNTQQSNQGPVTSPELPSPPSSPHDDICAVENSVTVDPRIMGAPHCSPNPENHPIHDSLALPVEQMSYSVMEGDADVLLQDFSSQHVSVSDGKHIEYTSYVHLPGSSAFKPSPWRLVVPTVAVSPLRQAYPPSPLRQAYPPSPLRQAYPPSPLRQAYPPSPLRQAYPPSPHAAGVSADGHRLSIPWQREDRLSLFPRNGGCISAWWRPNARQPVLSTRRPELCG
ncbi:unnamed protein product [Ranitomeya imitator]|uniref:Uncharacterized protein n=1 Tax=Ranitomeya imitator TaxID=111125 RepID=A0ABN9M9Q5_9NEOB|nr:unnamed protein product [Ranitomeya imitator]